MLVAAVAASSALLVLMCYAAGLLDNVERQSVDERFSWRGTQSPDGQIVIEQADGAVRLPIEDVAWLVLDTQQATLSATKELTGAILIAAALLLTALALSMLFRTLTTKSRIFNQ